MIWKSTGYETVAGCNESRGEMQKEKEKKRPFKSPKHSNFNWRVITIFIEWFLHPFEINRKLLSGCFGVWLDRCNWNLLNEQIHFDHISFQNWFSAECKNGPEPLGASIILCKQIPAFILLLNWSHMLTNVRSMEQLVRMHRVPSLNVPEPMYICVSVCPETTPKSQSIQNPLPFSTYTSAQRSTSADDKKRNETKCCFSCVPPTRLG